MKKQVYKTIVLISRKSLRLSMAFLAIMICAPIFQSIAQTKKPNVVLILVDDMGYKDAGFTGSDFYDTPNLNALAKQGMIFNNAYAGAGNCAPSRACLISGKYTPRHGIYAVYNTERGPINQMRTIPVPNTSKLAPDIYTVAEAMRDAGYKTAMFGKWHLGSEKSKTMPVDQGFDVDSTYNVPSKEDMERTNDPKWIYRITNGACEFIENNKDKPFFVYVSHHATHMPIQAREEMVEKFKDKAAGKFQSNKKFASMNSQMDDGVGILLKKIKDLGLDSNTLVIFTSDNGGLPQSPQTPFRGYKGMYYEGGIKEPFIASWPGVIKPGTQNNVPIINLDLYPTFIDVAGRKNKNGNTLDGESLVKLFKGGNQLERKSIFWHFPGYLDGPDPGSRDEKFRSRPVTTIRKGDWKLMLYHEEWALDGGLKTVNTNQAVELFNLKNDVSEQTNMANTNKSKRDELLGELLAWIKNTDAKLAFEPNPNYGKEQVKNKPIKPKGDDIDE